MRLRSNPFPRKKAEFIYFLVIALLLPIVVYYKITVVLPAVHEPGSFLYNLTLVLSLFGIFNFEGNIIACMIIDESVKPEAIPPAGSAERSQWHICPSCFKWGPPRSWHCKTCNICVVKRDHHCSFTGYCIGHENRRYFMCFIFYLMIGSTYAFIYSSYYMWVVKCNIYCNWLTPFKLIWPVSMLFIGGFWINIHIVVYCLNLVAIAYGYGMFRYHYPHVIRGEVCAEKDLPHNYDKGLYSNLKGIFGERMHLVWLSPLIKSPLPHDGYSLELKEDNEKIN